MITSAFQEKLNILNKNLMAAKTREEHDLADRAINNLVDTYCPKINNSDLNEANAMALVVAG